MAGFKGHLRGGAVFAVATAGIVLTQKQSIVGMKTVIDAGIIVCSTMAGSLLPDMDHPQSFLGRRMKMVSRPLYRYVGHRTLTHSFLFIGGIAYLLYTYKMTLVALGLSSGMLSHIMLDLIGMGSGVAFLYPIYPRRISFNMRYCVKRFLKKKRSVRRR